jgi:hypothetical protein
MIRATICTSRGYYHGESPTLEVPGSAAGNALRNGWHNHNHTAQHDPALWQVRIRE